MWIQVERLCFSITCDKMLLSRARVSGTWGLKLLGKRSTSRRCWYFSCLRMNCAGRGVRRGFQGEPPPFCGMRSGTRTPLPPRAQRSAPGEPPPACGALPAAGSARCHPHWEGRDRLSRGCRSRGQNVRAFPPLPPAPAQVAPAAPRLCGLYYGDTNIDPAGQETGLPEAQPGTPIVVIVGTGPDGSHPAPGTPGPAGAAPSQQPPSTQPQLTCKRMGT